jgi:acetyl-CoA acyltransferase
MSNQTQPVYIVEALRTPVGKAPRGVFKNTRPDDLLAHLIRAMVSRQNKLDPATIDDVIIGCAMPEAEQGMNVARNASLLADLPNTVPGMTINRFCSSGLQSIAQAADAIAAGNAHSILAGGTESMSMVPMGGHKLSPNPEIFRNNEHLAIAYGMGLTAEILAERFDISREQQEEFALESHRRATSAQDQQFFKDEIVPFTVRQSAPDFGSGQVSVKDITVDRDEGPRPDSSAEQLAKLRTVFSATGSVTAATSSQMSDGAGLAWVVSESYLKEHQLTPMARFVSYAVAGVPPEIMGIGPVSAIPKALTAAGLTLDDMEWIELNEAFASQSLAVMQEAKLAPARVNPQGGAIALGHPLGATGAIRTATLLHGMARQKMRYGMVTMCIGTGMGAAGIFESLS